MRFLGIGDNCDLSSLYLRLAAAGHEVKVHIADPMSSGTLANMVEHVDHWEGELSWVGKDGVILFENVAENRGVIQDRLRRAGHHVIGGSAFGDRLETDRAFAQRVLSKIGLPIASTREFDDGDAACDYIRSRPRRYVLKFNGTHYSSFENYVGRLDSGEDVAAVLTARLRLDGFEASSFVLMDHVDGIEMGVGAYFNGERFIAPACLDWEHKHFFPGDLGELTGEMGTVATYDGSRRMFEQTLAKMAPLLHLHGYCGYINLNTIVNERGIWPLEFTCRFGYPGFCVLEPLQVTPWSDLFQAMVSRRGELRTRSGFCVCIVVTTPPFPYERENPDDEVVGLPVMFQGELSDGDRRNLHYGEVGLNDGQLVTAGRFGWTLVVTGVAASIALAQAEANHLADRVIVPNLRYRRDIGAKLIAGDWQRVRKLDLISSAPDETPGPTLGDGAHAFGIVEGAA
jgi:phosphoribosylamine--glycine ligase